MKLINSVKWSILTELTARVLPPIVFLVLTNLLNPKDIGITTSALLIVALAQVFWDSGISKIIIQSKDNLIATADTVFWTSSIIGCIAALIVVALSEYLSVELFNDANIGSVLRVMSLYILIGSLCTVQLAYLQKHLKFKNLFWVRLVGSVAPSLVSLPSAYLGYGYWSLVAGYIAGQTLQLLALWKLCDWRPSLSFKLSILKKNGEFVAWVTLSSLLTWFFAWMDSLIIIKYLGATELGLYRTASTLATTFFALAFGPLIPVLYSYLSKNFSETSIAEIDFKILYICIIWVGIPISSFVFVYHSIIESLMFGVNWVGVGLLVGILFYREAIGWITGFNAEFYRIANKPHYESMVLALSIIVYIPAYYYLIQYDLLIFTIGRLALVATSLFFHLFLAKKLTKSKLFPAYKNGILFILTFYYLSFIVYQATRILSDQPLIQFIIGGILYIFICSFMFFLIEKNRLIPIMYQYYNHSKVSV